MSWINCKDKFILAHLWQVTRMNLTNGQAQRVGGIVRAGNIVQIKQALDHFLHLAFVGLTISGDGGFGFGGAEFRDGLARLHSGQRDNPARLRDSDSGGHILFEEESLDDNNIRRIQRDDLRQLLVDSVQAQREVGVGRGGDDTVRDMDEPIAAPIHHAITRGGGAGVQPKRAHGSVRHGFGHGFIRNFHIGKHIIDVVLVFQ